MRLLRRLCCLCLAACTLAACSALPESARSGSQAEQYMSENRLPEAVLAYRQALLSHPDDPGLLRGLARALAAQGRDRSAAQALERAAAVSPDDPAAQAALAGLTSRPQDGLGLRLAWLADGAPSEPVGAAAAEGRVIVAYAGGELLAFEGPSGRRLWQVESPAAFTSPPAAEGDQVWVGAEDGSLRIYAAGSGQPLGDYKTGAAVYAAPALTPGVAFCPSNDGWLYAVDRASLALRWKARVGEALHASPLAAGGSVYVGANDGRLYAFLASSGERLWPEGVLTQGAVESVPALDRGRLFFGSGDGRLYALAAADGSAAWRFSTPDAVYARPLVLGDRVIAASSGQILAALRSEDGAPLWKLDLGHPLMQPPVFHNNALYLTARASPDLYGVDAESGRLLGRLDTGDWIAQGPLEAGDGLVFAGKDGAVYLYR